jgi:hypothetical protein
MYGLIGTPLICPLSQSLTYFRLSGTIQPMFTTRRRSSRSSRSGSWSRKKTRRLPLPIALLIGLGALLGAELLLRAIAGFTGLNSTTDQSSNLANAYQLRFLSPSGQPYKTLPSPGKLLANRDPLLGYQLSPKQSSPFWTINAQGFRDTDDVPVQKPSGEVRIFVLGGTTAFGQLSASNQTMFAHQLEKLFNAQVADQKAKPNKYQPEILPYTADEVTKVLTRADRLPDRQYRVINAAVPGYASGNELAYLLQHVADYSPDIVLVLDGYDDLLLPSDRSGVEIPGLDDVLAGKGDGWSAQATGAIANGFNNLYLVKATQRWIFRKDSKIDPEQVRSLNLNATNLPLNQSLAANSTELDQRIARYQNHLLQMVRWSSAAKKQLIIGIQPEVTGYGKTKPSAAEASLVNQLGTAYGEQVRTGYGKLAAAANSATQGAAHAKVMNLYGMFGEKGKGGMFVTPTGLTDQGNGILAERIYRAIAADLAIKPKPFDAK